MKFKSLPVKFKTGATDESLAEGEFLVYPSTFTRTPDAYGDVVAKGAFADGIAHRKEQGIVLSGLYGHRIDDPHLNIAAAIDEGEDEHGWWVKGAFDLDDTTAAKVYRLVKSGRIRELSFAYDVLDESSVELEDGTKANELRKLDVFEFSFVPIGANRDTSVVAVKSAAEVLAEGMKAGRVLAQKHIDSLRSAQDAIGAVIAAAESQDDRGKAAEDGGGKAEDSSGGKAEDSHRSSSAKHLGLIATAL